MASKQTRVAAGGAALIASAMALSVPLIKHFEGKRNVTYEDVVGVPTACWGSTGPHVGRVGTRWTDGQCDTLLMADVAKHRDGVLTCAPGLAVRPQQLAAATSLAFNIGVAGFCRSTAARMFNRSQWRAGCEAFLLWTKAGGKVLPGLVRRRKAERDMCVVGL